MRNENYITIQGWMRNELNLKGNELIIYAIIYGFSQSENHKFTGSLKYLSEWCGISKQTTLNCLQSLVSKDFIHKNEIYSNGVKFVEYTADFK